LALPTATGLHKNSTKKTGKGTFCPGCGRDKHLRNLYPLRAKKVHICNTCHGWLTVDIGICPECPNNQQVPKPLFCPHPDPIKASEGIRVCKRCSAILRAPWGICCKCELYKPLLGKLPGQEERQLCHTCHWAYHTGCCPTCPKPDNHVVKPLPYWHPKDKSQGRVCQRCYDNLVHFGICPLCPPEKRVPKALPRPHPNRKARKKWICRTCYCRLQGYQLRVYEKVFGVCPTCPAKRRGTIRWLQYKHPLFETLRICQACRRTLQSIGRCHRCGKKRPRPRRDPINRTKRICDKCYREWRQSSNLSPAPERGKCNKCKRVKILRDNDPEHPNKKLCSNCYYKSHVGTCSLCGKVKPVPHRDPKQPENSICQSCWNKKANIGNCARCPRIAPRPRRDPISKQRICAACAMRLWKQKRKAKLALTATSSTQT
jgi:hypothetical protein